MTSALHAFICAIVATIYFFAVGFPFARRLHGIPTRAIAPILGWALHSALSLVILSFIGMSAATTALVACSMLVVSAVALRRSRSVDGYAASVPLLALIGAAILAAAIGTSVLPKGSGDTIALSGPIFDHAKVAMIDEMVRAGVPATNPFFGPIGSYDRLPYYYLWHFSAAQFALVLGINGWEADAGLTVFTAFASLSLMLGLATWISGRTTAAYWALALAATASVRPVADWIFGPANATSAIRSATGFGGWLFQSAWAPQHVASACCAILTVLLIARLARKPAVLEAAVLATVVAAGYESSAWIGGIVVATAAAGCGLMCMILSPPAQRWRLLAWGGLAVILAAALALGMLRDQFIATAMRGSAPILTVEHYEVLGGILPEKVRRIFDLPAYWLVQLSVEFPAFYLTGIAGFLAWRKTGGRNGEQGLPVAAIVLLAAVSLVSAWLLVSTIGANNDLGWRAVLPGAMILIAFAASCLARSSRLSVWLAGLAGIAVGLPHGVALILDYTTASPRPLAAAFGQTPELWEAVRRQTGERDRIANNPLFLEKTTPWPINISWALLANRRSCYAGKELALPFVPLPPQRRQEIDDKFVRVFAGEPHPDDVGELASRFGCDAVVLTVWDGAWTRDPFAASSEFTKVEETTRWRIYRRTRFAEAEDTTLKSR